MFKDMKKNYSSPFHWEQNSRRRVLTAVWGVHVIIWNSFFRQKFWCIFFRNSLLKEGCRFIFLKASKLKCFLISLVWLKYDSIKYKERKMTTFAKFLRPTDRLRSFCFYRVIGIKYYNKYNKNVLLLLYLLK